MLFYGFLFGTADPVRKFSDIFSRLQCGVAASDRIFACLDREPAIRSPKNPVPCPRHRRELSFEGVSFEYQPGTRVLDDVTLRIPFGETIAIVGPNGCGKSTLANLIPRFADPIEGRIRLDGVPLTDLRLRDLRGQIGLVTQEPLLFDDTVFNNIRYGRPRAGRDEVIEAAKRAHAHNFIESELTDGYETVVGTLGGRLSGGQRQRIALARAILRDPAILILDEATSQIDLESEQAIQEVLEEFTRGRTTVHHHASHGDPLAGPSHRGHAGRADRRRGHAPGDDQPLRPLSPLAPDPVRGRAADRVTSRRCNSASLAATASAWPAALTLFQTWAIRPLGIDQRRSSARPLRRPCRNCSSRPSAVLGQHLVLRIAQQLDPQLVLGDELPMAFRRVGADADHPGRQFLELVPVRRELAGLGGAAGRVVLGIKIQHGPLPQQVFQRHFLAVLVRQRKGRGFAGKGGRLFGHRILLEEGIGWENGFPILGGKVQGIVRQRGPYTLYCNPKLCI